MKFILTNNFKKQAYTLQYMYIYKTIHWNILTLDSMFDKNVINTNLVDICIKIMWTIFRLSSFNEK